MLSRARLAPGAGGLLGAIVAAACLAACGDEQSPKPVHMTISNPVDAAVIHDDSVEVTGSVRPARARVLVAGRPARVAGGRFRAVVPLEEGSNLIDVGGSARGAATTWTAVRVAREVLVAVPDLTGLPGDEAVDRLAAVGLHADVDRQGGFLDPLVPGDPLVCELRPGPGTKLAKGASVTVTVSKMC